MWLPETAVNLHPGGARSEVRHPLALPGLAGAAPGRRPWERVEGHPLDTTQAYRCYLPDAGGRPGEKAAHRGLFL